MLRSTRLAKLGASGQWHEDCWQSKRCAKRLSAEQIKIELPLASCEGMREDSASLTARPKAKRGRKQAICDGLFYTISERGEESPISASLAKRAAQSEYG